MNEGKRKPDNAQVEESERSRLALLSILEDEKTVKQKLRESEERYRALVETQRDMITRWKPDTTLTYVNQAYCEYSGKTKDELLGKSWVSLLAEGDREIVGKKYEELAKNPVINEYEQQSKNAGGSTRWTAWSEVPIFDKRGVLVEFQSVGHDITLLKQAEQELKRSEHGLRKAQELGHIGSWEWDIKENKIFWSDELYKIWGVSKDFKLTQETIISMIHPEDRAHNQSHLMSLLGQAEEVSFEFRIVRPDGSIRNIFQNVEVTRGQNKEAIWACGVMQDITSRKKGEQIQQALYSISDAALGCQDLQQLFILIHKTIARLLPAENLYIALYDDKSGTISFPYYRDKRNEYTAPRRFGKGLTEYVITTQKPLMVNNQVHDQLKREGKAEFIGHPSKQWLGVPLQSGGKTFGTLVVQSYEENTGYSAKDLELLNFVGGHVASAILSIKTSKNLAESETRYRTFIDSTDDMAFLKDSNLRYLMFNLAFERFLHLPPESIEGHNDREVMPEDLAIMCHQTDLQVLESEQSIVSNRSYRDRHYETKKFPVILGDGSTGVGGYIRDITDMVRAEEQRKLMGQELEQAQKMEAIGHLAGGVAHDFNNMLTGIIGNAELLQIKLSGNKETEGPIENIIKSAGHAANLTKQLLAFARKGQYQLVPINVHKIIGETCSLLSSTIDRRISIEQSLRANPSIVMADPTQLENCLMNLGINARDAMPNGGRLVFSTEVVELDREYIALHQYHIQPGQYIQISVSDNGTGMTDEVKKHLFEPFFTTKEPGRGTGLGLAGAYGCIKNHGGSIEVYSEVEHGTAIKIYLPLLPRDKESAPVARQPAQPVKGTGTVMIVDDEEVIRGIATQLLENAGYKVVGCRDGSEAVATYRCNKEFINLVILDMIMPHKNGRETFFELRKINPEVRVLLSSGFSEDGEAQEIIDSGAKGFIQKPYRSTELLNKVQSALAGSGQDEKESF